MIKSPKNVKKNIWCIRVSDRRKTEPLYNGNIAQTFWKTATDNTQRGYTYNYDQLNRLRTADFYKSGTVPYTGSNGEYIAYDLNGNIVHLIRNRVDAQNNPIDMDILTYTYQNGNNNSNRLMKVTDAASVGATQGFNNGNSGTSNDYTYDANGNILSDLNKGITNISYNFLNLPELITFGNGNTIEYLYNAAGVKVHKTVTDLTSNVPNIYTDYLDVFQYVGGMLNGRVVEWVSCRVGEL